ncbi:MAG: hypothetical protein C0419_05635 [Microbacterium sp.]|nr:hypothetical protein [Microbacterium sp.]
MPWFLIVGLVTLPLVFVFPLLDGYGRQGSPSVANLVGQQALVIGVVIGLFMAETMIRGYQWFLASALARVARTLDSDSLALLVLPEAASEHPPFASYREGVGVWRVWPRGYPRVIVVSPRTVLVRTPTQHLASLDSAVVERVVLVNTPRHMQSAVRLLLAPPNRSESEVDEFLDFLWIDSREGLRPVSHPERIEETRATVERVLQSPRGEATAQ